MKEATTGHFLFFLERRKRTRIANNATSAKAPRTQPTMIAALFEMLDDGLWAAADPEVLVILLVDEGPEVDEVMLSGSSTLG